MKSHSEGDFGPRGWPIASTYYNVHVVITQCMQPSMVFVWRNPSWIGSVIWVYMEEKLMLTIHEERGDAKKYMGHNLVQSLWIKDHSL